MPDLAQTIATVAVAIGLPGVLALIGRGIFQQITGRAGRERERNTSYLTRSIREAERADREAIARRKTQEYASELRRQAIENGYEPAPWPEGLDRTLTAAEIRKIRNKKEQ